MLAYYSPVFRESTVYSIDMVRLKLDFSGKEYLDVFLEWLSGINDIYIERHPVSHKAYAYRNLFQITCKSNNCSFVIGLSLNGSNPESYYLGFMEFNPNKVSETEEFQEIFLKLQECCFCAEIIRWDLAVDVPERRDMCEFSLDGYDGPYHLHEKSALDKTECLRKRNKHGYVKLYNKQKESGLDYELTRLEITVDGKATYTDFSKICPEVIVKGDGNRKNFYKNPKLFKTDIVLLEMLMLLDMSERERLFKEFTRRKKEKFRPYFYNVYGSPDQFVVSEEVFNQLKHQLRNWTIGIDYSLIDDNM